MIEIKNVSKSFGGLKALDECSLEIENGKITALIGPNGSGKSTLFNTISGLLKQEQGSVTLNENNLAVMEDFQIARKGISRTFQETRLFKNLTIKEHLEIAMSVDNENLSASIFLKPASYDDKINKILELVGLEKNKLSCAADLSYGQRKLLDLALAIASPHDVLLLDEPVAGVNPKLRAEIKKILRNLRKNSETVLLIEHDMNFVMDLADYIFVLDYGKVIAKGKPRQIQKNKKVLEAYLGK